MLAKVMSPNVTFKDWTEFRTFMEGEETHTMSLEYLQKHGLTAAERDSNRKWLTDFCVAARHVAQHLPFEEVMQDTLLMLACTEM